MAMNGMSKMAAIALLLAMVIVPAAFAATFKVGGDDEWASGVDYTTWAAGKTFTVGDILEFKYGNTHSVDVVDKAGYDNCDGSSASSKHSDGDTKIELKTVGPQYYICPTLGHCANGMKLTVTVLAASPGTPDAPSPPSTTPGTPATPDSPPAAGTPATPTPAGSGSTSPPPPPPKGSGASKGVMSYVLVGASLVFGYGLWM